MLQLTINEKGGPSRTESFDKDEVTIGRVQGNDIILPKGNISKRHSRIVLKDGKFIIVDLKSTNGTYVNGKKITAPQVIKSTDKVYIGDFTLQIDYGQNEVEEAPRGRSIPGAEEEIDLFGGGEVGDYEPEPIKPSQPSPGLIDENFDQEFEAARLPLPSKRPSLRSKSVDLGTEDFGASSPVPEPARLDFDPPPAEPVPEPEPLVAASAPVVAEKAVVPELQESPGVGASLHAQEAVPTSLPKAAAANESRLALVTSDARMPIPGANAMPHASQAVVSLGIGTSDPLVPHFQAEPLELEEVLVEAQRSVIRSLSLPGQPLEAIASLRSSAEEAAQAAVAALADRLPIGHSQSQIVDIVLERTIGIEPIADFLTDDSIFEVVLTADRRILVDREGRLEASGRTLGSESEALGVIHSLAILAGLEPGELPAVIDARLRSGDRLLATLPPAAFRGPGFTVRKTTRDFFTLEKLQEYDTINSAVLTLLDAAVRYRKSLLLSTGPGVTGTATLNALLSQIPTDERIVTAERGVELHLRAHAHAVAFDLHREMGMTEVLKYASAAQADRVFVGELSEEDAVPVVDGYRSSLDGGAVSVPASSIEEAVARVSGWVAEHRSSDEDAARRTVAEAFTLVLQESKLSDNSRRVTEVGELIIDGDQVRIEPLFRFEPRGVDESMMITGTFVPYGRVPSFIQELVDRGEAEFDLSIYQA